MTIRILGRSINFDKAAIAHFNAQWPASQLDTSRSYWFEFDENRNLIDTDCEIDGPETLALAADAETYIFDYRYPEWHP
jgi:hypothetical protein